jgi:GDPmannose 4,6-dehydratase
MNKDFLLDGKIHLGNVEVRRDFGFAGDYVEAMHAVMRSNVATDFVIGTGKTYSIAEFCQTAFAIIGKDWRDHVVSRADLFRKSDADRGADPSKLKTLLGFSFRTSFSELVAMMVRDRIERLQGTAITPVTPEST